MGNATVIGLFAGTALGFAAAFGGLLAFLLVLVFGALGLLVGRVMDGELDLSEHLGGGRDRRRSPSRL